VTTHAAEDLLAAAGLEGQQGDVLITDVEKSFGSHRVLRKVSLRVARGEVVALVGPSGAGKSTLLRCVAHLEQVDSGVVGVNGTPMGMERRNGSLRHAKGRAVARQRREVGMVFQDFQLFPHLPVLENVTLGPVKVLRRPAAEAERVGRELLERVGLGEKVDAYPRRLSGGQQQRVAIVRALAMGPAVMLFDEPTSALDPEMTGEVLSVMEELAAEGMTMMIVTHEMGFARRAADRMVMMHDGEIIEAGPPDELCRQPSDSRTEKFLSCVLS
jgi:polar amino acid transport system ATP-binding protein